MNVDFVTAEMGRKLFKKKIPIDQFVSSPARSGKNYR
jgi:hypothetical protein